MHLSSSVLGKNIVDKLTSQTSAVILTIGRDTFNRTQLSKIGCFNFIAAIRLSKLLTDELQVKDTKDLFTRIHPAALALPGLGAISLATLGAAFEAKGIGTLDSYVARHYTKQEIVTFHTMKVNADTKAAAREKKDSKTRARGRSRQAHEHRVRRHLARHDTTHSASA